MVVDGRSLVSTFRRFNLEELMSRYLCNLPASSTNKLDSAAHRDRSIYLIIKQEARGRPHLGSSLCNKSDYYMLTDLDQLPVPSVYQALDIPCNTTSFLSKISS